MSTKLSSLRLTWMIWNLHVLVHKVPSFPRTKGSNFAAFIDIFSLCRLITSVHWDASFLRPRMDPGPEVTAVIFLHYLMVFFVHWVPLSLHPKSCPKTATSYTALWIGIMSLFYISVLSPSGVGSFTENGIFFFLLDFLVSVFENSLQAAYNWHLLYF